MSHAPSGARPVGAALLALAALSLAAFPAGATAQGARCAGYEPQPRPQNIGKPVVGQDLDAIVERGYITIAAYEDFQPFSRSTPSGPVGIDIEIGRLIATALGVEPRFNIVAADSDLEADLQNQITRGSIVGGAVSNLMMRVPYDPEFACRVEQVAFTGQYARERIAIAYRRAAYSEDDPPLPGHFRRRKVAVENNSIADFYLSSLLSGRLIPNIRRYPTTAEAMQAVEDGEVSAAMGMASQLQHHLAEGLAMHRPTLPGFATGEWTLGLAVHANYRPLAYAVDDAVIEGLRSGHIAEIYRRHGVTLLAPER